MSRKYEIALDGSSDVVQIDAVEVNDNGDLLLMKGEHLTIAQTLYAAGYWKKVSLIEDDEKLNCSFCGKKAQKFYVQSDRRPDVEICGPCIEALNKDLRKGGD